MSKSGNMQKYMDEKFHKLKKEGYEGKQRVAVALSMARKAGYKVPKKGNK